jgi:hypothetical protein
MSLTYFSMGAEMALVEYLYVDEKRLDTYFEQISSPVTYDKVPMWNAEIGLTGPKAGGAQQRFARPFTTHEKISKLTEYLEDKGHVEYGRSSGKKEGTTFRIETCQAKRVFIPPDRGQPPDVGALNVWISAVPRTREELKAILERRGEWAEDRWSPGPGNLYLLEAYQHSDSYSHGERLSPFSTISIMMGDYVDDHSPLYFRDLLRPEFNGLFNPDWVDLDAADKIDPGVKAEVEKSDLLPDERKTSLYHALAFASYFLIDPAEALAQIPGAQIAPERRIRTLYRVRKAYPEAELAWNYGQWDIATFGYPIFIAEDTDPV